MWVSGAGRPGFFDEEGGTTTNSRPKQRGDNPLSVPEFVRSAQLSLLTWKSPFENELRTDVGALNDGGVSQ
jgi:hypothetical protein